MASDPSHLLDTNVLLRLSKRDDPFHELVKTALDALTARGADICCTPQNVSEFWNVCTRPKDRNGFGLSVPETDQTLQTIERTVTVLPDNEQVYRTWRLFVSAIASRVFRFTMPAWQPPCTCMASRISSR